MMFDRLRRLMDSPLGAVLGGAAYGSWAVIANWSAGSAAALRIGAAHFAMSTGLTLAGVAVMNRLFALARRPQAGAALAFCGSMALTYALLISVHTALHTPHLLLTLAPGFIPTLSFCTLYSLLLLRHARQQQMPQTTPNEERDEIPSVLR